MPLQIGSWTGSVGGQPFNLNIGSVDSSGLMQGSVTSAFFAGPASGMWDEDAQKLIFFLEAPNVGDLRFPAGEVLTAYLFTDSVNLTGVTGSVIFTLVGQLEHFGLFDPFQLGVTAKNTNFGWYAQIGVD